MAEKPVIKEKKKGIQRRISWIWAVPTGALVVSLGLALNQYMNQDVEIEITFPDAAGMKPDQTQMRFNDVTVGHVTDIRFSEDLKRVIVTVAVEREMAHYIDADAKFWLVEPQITASRISGLDTLLTGSYINAEWDASIGEARTEFRAETNPPIVPLKQEGTDITLKAYQADSISAGAPIYYRGINVGIVRDVRLSEDGYGVNIRGFVFKPYDSHVSTSTRFWNASGVRADIGTGGLSIQMASIATLVQGGIEFSNPYSDGQPIARGAEFDLYPTQAAAETSQLVDETRGAARLSSVFDSTVKGLSVGADVQYRGIRIGRVEGIIAIPNTDPDPKTALRLQVSYSIQPQRIGLGAVEDSDDTYEAIDRITQRNHLRARLVPQSLLGGLMIEIFEDDATAQGEGLDFDATPFPRMPSSNTQQDGLSAAAEQVLTKVADLRLQEALDDVQALIRSVTALTTDEETRRIPGEVATLFDNANAFVGSEEVQKIPGEVNKVIAEITGMLDTLQQGQTAENLVAAMANLRDVMAQTTDAAQKFPGIADNVDQLIAKANSLPMQELIKSTDKLVQTADGFLAAGIDEDVPEALSGALAEVRDTLAELRAGGTTENLNATLRSARETMVSIQQASDRLPELSRRLEQLANEATQTVQGFNPSSPMYRRVVATVENINAASRSLDSLLRQLERKPNSILIGR